MMPDIKPLIVILVAAVSAQSQDLADAARKERARQAQNKSTRVFSDGNSHLLKSTAPAPAPKVPAPAAGAAAPKASTAVSAAGAVTPKAGATPELPGATLNAAAAAPVDTTAEEMQKLRIRVRALEGQETSLKLLIIDVTNQVYAPLTDQTAHNEALAKLGETQVKLSEVQKELAQARSNLQELEIKAAAKK